MTFHNVSDLFELASLCVAVTPEYTAKTQTRCISRHRFDQNISACFSGNRAAVHYYKYASKWAGVSKSAIIYIVVFFLHLFFVFHLEGISGMNPRVQLWLDTHVAHQTKADAHRLHLTPETPDVFCECQALDCWTRVNGWFPLSISKTETMSAC